MYTFCCDNLWKSVIMARGNSAKISFFVATLNKDGMGGKSRKGNGEGRKGFILFF